MTTDNYLIYTSGICGSSSNKEWGIKYSHSLACPKEFLEDLVVRHCLNSPIDATIQIKKLLLGKDSVYWIAQQGVDDIGRKNIFGVLFWQCMDYKYSSSISVQLAPKISTEIQRQISNYLHKLHQEIDFQKSNRLTITSNVNYLAQTVRQLEFVQITGNLLPAKVMASRKTVLLPPKRTIAKNALLGITCAVILLATYLKWTAAPFSKPKKIPQRPKATPKQVQPTKIGKKPPMAKKTVSNAKYRNFLPLPTSTRDTPKAPVVSPENKEDKKGESLSEMKEKSQQFFIILQKQQE